MIKLIQRIKAALRFTEIEGPLLYKKIRELEAALAHRTEVSCDIHYRGQSYAIMVGRYRNVDYVECFGLGDGDFNEMVERLRSRARYTSLSKVDVPMNFHAVFKREFEWPDF